MPALYHILLIIHVAAGVVGLIAFWIPLFARKGGRLHIRAGWVFATALLVVSLTAATTAVWTLLDPIGTRPPLSGVTDLAAYVTERRVLGALLAYLAILTFSFGWQGIQVIENKNQHDALRSPFTIALNAALFASALGILFIGIRIGAGVLIGMSVIGLAVGPLHLAYVLKREVARMEWFYKHFGAMLGGGIAFHTAFFVFGASRLLPGFESNVVMWFAPALVGGAGIMFLNVYYRRKFACKSEARIPVLSG